MNGRGFHERVPQFIKKWPAGKLVLVFSCEQWEPIIVMSRLHNLLKKLPAASFCSSAMKGKGCHKQVQQLMEKDARGSLFLHFPLKRYKTTVFTSRLHNLWNKWPAGHVFCFPVKQWEATVFTRRLQVIKTKSCPRATLSSLSIRALKATVFTSKLHHLHKKCVPFFFACNEGIHFHKYVAQNVQK